MPVQLISKKTISVGNKDFVEAHSPNHPFAIVFEDDGETGYLYALDFNLEGNRIVNAMHIYNVANIIDRDKPSEVKLVWSLDGLKAALKINEYVHAIFDFEAHRGYCRSGFPSGPSHTGWTQFNHDWDDNAINLFK